MKIFIRTFGCAHNRADSEMMGGLLQEAGHEITEKEAEANLVIINSCTVKDPSQKRFVHEVQRAAQTHKVIVAGCVPQANPEELVNFSAIGVKQIHKIVSIAERTMDGERVRELKKTMNNTPLIVPVKRRNPYVEILPINSGCLGRCTFCKTKHARGHLSSYAEEDILEKARRALEQGIKEFWLTSEDLGAYGRDRGTTLVELARKILALEGDFRVRLGMANPPLMHDLIDGLIEVLNHPKCYRFVHIPVQSGSNTILRTMQREYTVEEFEEVVQRLRNGVPGITIATDIIVGFPGETEEDFTATTTLLERQQFPIINVSKFYARPGTPAATYKPVASERVKERSERLHQFVADGRVNEKYVGQTIPVLFIERGTGKHADSIIGHTPNYRTVVIKKGAVEIGTCKPVRIVSSQRHYLVGEAE